MDGAAPGDDVAPSTPSPKDNGRTKTTKQVVRRAQTPPEVPPGQLGMALMCLLMLLWLFAYTPTPIVAATVPGMVGFLLLVERCRTWRQCVLWLTLFGAVATGVGYRWLAETVQLFGGVQPAFSWVLVALFGAWNIVHAWIFAAFYRGLLSRGRRPHPLVTVALFVGCEALPIRMFGWMSGHGAVDVPPLLQSAEWGGVVGVSFALCCLVVPIHEWIRWAFVRRGAPARPGAALFTFVIGLVLFGWGLWRYGDVRQGEIEAERHIRVGIAQANVGTFDKRRATEEGGAYHANSLERYRRATALALKAEPDLILWPESAITNPVPMKDARVTYGYLRQRGYEFLLEAGKRSALLVGLYERHVGRESLATGERLQNRYNAAGLRPAGGQDEEWQIYRKVHLIPFGETTPFDLFDSRLPQKFKMIAGELPQDLLTLGDVTIAPFLCYEAILPEHVRMYVAGQRPDLLVSQTNDSWFGDTWEPHQHLNFTRFRAVEHRAPIARSTNTGISAFISATGDIEERLGVGQEGALVRDVPLAPKGAEPTIYVRFGHHFATLLWAFALLAWITALLRPRE